MAVTDLDTALDMLEREDSGAVWFTDYDGSEAFASGRLDVIETERDDPDGIGWFSLVNERGVSADIPFSGFQELVECPVGTQV